MRKTCSVDGCENHTHAKGMCNPHYVRAREFTAPRCIEPGCPKAGRARQMCTSHYEKFLRETENIEDYNDFWEFVKKEMKIEA